MNQNKQSGYTINELLVAIIVILGLIGWILNIAKITWVISEPITGMFVLRVVGIFLVPLGSILGFC